MKCTLLAPVILLAAATTAQATVISSSAAIQGQGTQAGLSGAYYKAQAGSTNYSIGTTLSVMGATAAAGRFTATSLNYGGNDYASITSFLGQDGGSYTGRAAAAYDLVDGILDMSGYLYVAGPSTLTFALSHDDSAQLTIGGQMIISSSCCGTDTALVSFGTAGYYAIDLVYSNTNYYYVGGGSVNLTQNGRTLTSANLVQNVTPSPAQNIPEPASLALLGVTLVGLGAVWRRKPATGA